MCWTEKPFFFFNFQDNVWGKEIFFGFWKMYLMIDSTIGLHWGFRLRENNETGRSKDA